MAFTGFPKASLAFLAGLAADNSRSYWQEHKAVYDEAVKGPMEALIAEVDARFRPLRIFRPNRDVRFSKDKSPYKLNCGAVGETQGGAINYVHIAVDGLFAGSGSYILAKDQLERFRAAIANPKSGPKFVDLANDYRAAKGIDFSHGGHEPLKVAPSGYPKDHPRIEFLRWKGAIIGASFGTPAWIHTRKAKDRIEALWAAADPLNAWLERNVGPSELAPEEWGR